MKRFDSTLLKVFLYGLHTNAYLRLLNSLAGLVIAIWMTLSLYLSVRLMVSGPFRDLVIARITFMRERDEREVILTGKATRTTFLTTLAILIFLFCLSCFHVSIYKVPQERAVEGKTGMVSLGLGFSLLEHPKQDKPKPEDIIKKKDIFTYSGLPVSSTSVILILIVWQIISYNYSIRRLTR